jgi:hypothetical protein
MRIRRFYSHQDVNVEPSQRGQTLNCVRERLQERENIAKDKEDASYFDSHNRVSMAVKKWAMRTIKLKKS